MTKNQPEVSLKRVDRFIHHVQWEYHKEGQTLNQDTLKDGNNLLETLADEFKLENTAI